VGDRERQRLIMAAMASAIVGTSAPAFAQDENPCIDAQECPDLTEIVVTGSRIPSPDSSPAPLQRSDAEDIDESGVVNIQELLNQQPVFGSPALNRTNSNFHTDAAGMGTVDLRNLGENRTLVLLNGRRIVPSVPGTGVVDLNIIPTQLVSRIEVLTGGASSIYGSDAIAGVVNIILDDRFDGLKAEGQSGISEQGDDVRRQASLTYGTSFAEGRGHVVLAGSYSDEGSVFSRSRKRTATNPIDCFTAEGGDPFETCAILLSSRAPEGRIDVGPTNEAKSFTFFGANVVLGRPAGFNFNVDRLIAIPTKRYQLNALGRFDVSEGLNARFEGSFASSEIISQLEPLGIDSLEVFPETDGRLNIEHDLVGPGGTVVRVRNPLVQDEIFDAAADSNGDGARDVGFARRLSEFGNRRADADRETLRLVAGLEGLAFGDWRWNAFYSYGRSTEKQVMHGLLDLTKLRLALQVVPDVFDEDHDGNLTEAICLDPPARKQGCIPANLFGGAGALSPAVPYLQVPGHMSARVTQNLVGASVTGSLITLPAGPIDVALGTEYRRESARFEFDELTNSGLNGSNPLPDIAGSFDVIEGYAEFVAPIVSHRRLAESLKLRGAVRVANYSTIGTSWNWSYGVEFMPLRGVRFRAAKARATRAPNIGELFMPPGEGLTFFVEDPCVNVTVDTPGPLGTTCRSYPGVVVNIAQNERFEINELDAVFISTFGGNPELQEEKADSLTIGLVLNPVSGALRDLTLTVDYFDIEVSDAMFPLTIEGVLDQCFNKGNLNFCDFVARRPLASGGNSAGSLQRVDTTIVNSGGLDVRGIDATLSYHRNLLGGRVDLSVAYTHLLDGHLIPLPGSARDRFAWEIGSSRDRALTTIRYERGKWGVTARGQYVGPAYLDDQLTGVEAGGEGSGKFKTGAEFIVDAQIRFTPSDHTQFYLGADNLFDNAPPFISTALGGHAGTNTDAGTYDAIGRRFYAGARVRF
jgi:iron complex outermembrane receptor protein